MVSLVWVSVFHRDGICVYYSAVYFSSLWPFIKVVPTMDGTLYFFLISLCLDTHSSIYQYLRSCHSCSEVQFFFFISQLLNVVSSWVITGLGPWVWHIKHPSPRRAEWLTYLVCDHPGYGCMLCVALVCPLGKLLSIRPCGCPLLLIRFSLPSLGLLSRWLCRKSGRKHQRRIRWTGGQRWRSKSGSAGEWSGVWTLRSDQRPAPLDPAGLSPSDRLCWQWPALFGIAFAEENRPSGSLSTGSPAFSDQWGPSAPTWANSKGHPSFRAPQGAGWGLPWGRLAAVLLPLPSATSYPNLPPVSDWFQEPFLPAPEVLLIFCEIVLEESVVFQILGGGYVRIWKSAFFSLCSILCVF